jgi:hypothetical protein
MQGVQRGNLKANNRKRGNLWKTKLLTKKCRKTQRQPSRRQRRRKQLLRLRSVNECSTWEEVPPNGQPSEWPQTSGPHRHPRCNQPSPFAKTQGDELDVWGKCRDT